MQLNEFKDKVFAKAKEEGFLEYELYYVDGESFKVNIYKGEIDEYSLNTSIGLSFRGIFNEKMGYSYTEILDDASVEQLVKMAKENAMVIDNEDEEFIYDGSGEYVKINSYNEELARVSVEEKIKLAMELEKDTENFSDKVKTVKTCVVVSGEGSNRIINSKGLDVSHKSNVIYAVVIPVAELDGQVNTGDAFAATNKFDEVDTKLLAKESVEKALSYMGAESIDSGKYKVAIKNEVMADILDTFWGVFSSYNVQKQLSLLNDKTGQQIASKKVTIVDDPHRKDGVSVGTPFDAEGVPTYKKDVIKEGILQTLLYNLKTAHKDNLKTTGNASKGSYASTVGISPFNFYISPGEKDFDAVIAEVGEGVLITMVEGLHSGANMVSGDFSLAAKGFSIKAGKLGRAVEQITIAGNFYELLKNIIEVGADLRFGMPGGDSCFGSPTIIVNELSISGK